MGAEFGLRARRARAAGLYSRFPRNVKTTEGATILSAHGQYNAEAYFPAVHLFVTFRHPAQRVLLDHRAHAGKDAERQRVFRVFRAAGVATRHGLTAENQRKRI